ncbi:MAG: type VI secretion system baseplate subunit TssK [Pirellula sp.]|nr:type VI secretion system baseplate subunit TssK [Pirellula sp.]
MHQHPVHWYEGAFLRPQHFQAAERHWASSLARSSLYDNPHHYGIVSIDFSRESLANHQFELRRLQARMPDGTLVDLAIGEEPSRIDLQKSFNQPSTLSANLSDAFDKEKTIKVYLAIPNLRLGRVNVGARGQANQNELRYLEENTSYPDESWGGDEQEIQLKRLNVQLLVSTQDLSGYCVLPLAQIKRSSDGESSPQLDNTYIPPLLTVDAWPYLNRDIMRGIYDMIGQKIELLSQQVINRGIGLDSRDPGDAERILMLSQLNEAYAVLSILAFDRGVPPRVAYIELCRIVGQLSVFSAAKKVADLMPYDHDNLQEIFADVRSKIEALIHAVRDYEVQQRYFVGIGHGLQVALDPRWFNSDWQWFIGVDKGELTQRECLELLSAGQLDLKLGSSRQVEFLFKQRVAGVTLTPVDRPVRALPGRADWVFFEVPRQDTPAWRDVQETQTLAIRLKDSLIANLDRLQGQQTLVVVAFGRKIALKFALFAVPAQS